MDFPIYFYFEVLTLAVACFKYKALLNSRYKYLLPLMVLVVIYETCSLYNVFAVKGTNLWVVNIVAVLEFLFYSFFTRNLLTSVVFKKAVAITAVIVAVYSVLSVLFITGFYNLGISAIIIQIMVIIVITGRYFWELVQVPFSSSLSLIKQPGFWINTGVLFYYLEEFFFFASFNYMAYKKNEVYLNIWMVISNTANAILYTCFIIGLLCIKPTKESLQ